MKAQRKYNGFEYGVNFLGTDDVLTFIHNYLVENNLTNKKLYLEKRKQNQIVSSIRYGGNDKVERILNHLYYNSSIFLYRKEERYQELLRQNRSRAYK